MSAKATTDGTSDDGTTTEDTGEDATSAGADAERWKALAQKWEGRAKKNYAATQDLEQRLKAISDKDKSEVEKLIEAAAAAELRAGAAEAQVMRLEVAQEHGLTSAQAARLQGDTREALEADAEELLKLFKDDDTPRRPPGGKPAERLRGGGDPATEVEELDPRKLAARVTRRY